MKLVIYVYTESYHDAKRLLNALCRPCIDKANLCTEESWEDGNWLEIERDTEIWRIGKREPQESEE